MKYDTIVIGSGSAGSIIATRLTEDPNRHVLLLEAGPDYPDFEHLPEEVKFGYATEADVMTSDHNWQFIGKATDTSSEMLVPRGKVTGGSSAINGQVFLRGVPEDYDTWASWGNDEWNFEKCLPYFRKLETDTVRSHLPAVVASPEFELTAVCTTRMESAEESRQKFGARLAFNDYRKMLDHPDIDAVAVSLRVPAHYEPTMDALNGGKHVYTEWPLGRTTAEAVEMADLARERVSATWWDSSPEPTRCCFTSRTLWLRATWAR